MTELLKRMSDEATSKLQGLERQLCAHHNALAFHHMEACQAVLDADSRLSVPAHNFSQGSGATASATSSAAGDVPSARQHHGHIMSLAQGGLQQHALRSAACGWSRLKAPCSAGCRGDSAVCHDLCGILGMGHCDLPRHSLTPGPHCPDNDRLYRQIRCSPCSRQSAGRETICRQLVAFSCWRLARPIV